MKKIALVVGNGNYQNTAKLKNPTNDSQDIKTSLEKIGFQVFYGENLKQTEFKRLVRDFSSNSNGAEISLFYYAGHGLQLSGRNFLVPTDAEILSEDEIPDSTISLDFIQNRMEDSKAKLNIFFIDACRDNPFEKNIENANGRNTNLARGLSNPNMYFTHQSIISFATAPNEIAFDNPKERNGIYTKSLLKYIGQIGVKIDDVLKSTIRDVIIETDNTQIPWIHQKLYDDFYLNGKESENFSESKEPENSDVQKDGEFENKVYQDSEIEDGKNVVANWIFTLIVIGGGNFVYIQYGIIGDIIFLIFSFIGWKILRYFQKIGEAEKWFDKGVNAKSDFQKQIYFYTKAIEINPNDSDTYNNRGIVYDDLKKYDLAISDYSKAIEINPNYAKAYNNRGNAYRHIDNFRKAKADAMKSVELGHDRRLLDFLISKGH